MSQADNDSFIAMPPPGAPKATEPAAEPASTVTEEDFISLPPGIALDSGTFKIPARTPPAREPAPDVVFVPTVLGAAPAMPIVAPARPEPAKRAEPSAPVVESTPVAEPVEAPAPPTPAAPTPVAEPVEAPALPTAPTAVAASAPRLAWRLQLPAGGDPIYLDGTVLVGRNPAASVDWPSATLLGVADPTRSVSKTHALLEVDGDDLWVHDLDSTNGVFIVASEDEVVEVAAGTRSQLAAGVDLELGDYVLRVERG